MLRIDLLLLQTLNFATEFIIVESLDLVDRVLVEVLHLLIISAVGIP
jgi:hypothetical protein